MMLVDDGLRPYVKRVLTLRGDEAHDHRTVENNEALGGMRNPAKAIKQVPGHVHVGHEVGQILNDFLNHHPHVRRSILSSIGKSKAQLHAENFADELTEEHLEHLRWEVALCLGADLDDDTNLTEIVSPLIKAWIHRSKDPDTPLAEWLRNGAPAGITRQPANVGIFPTSEAPPSQEFSLAFWDGSEVNYVSMDDSPFAQEVLSKLVDSGYVIKCDGIEEAKSLLNNVTPVISKGALISKEKDGVMKHRLILDCRVSGTNSATRKWERIVLPKIWDIIRDVMHLWRDYPDGSLSFLVCDITDAFYKVPLDCAEWPYFVLFYNYCYYVWTRLGQGSLNGPTLFGRFSAFLGRASQGMLEGRSAFMQIYTDDPIISICSSSEDTQATVSLIILFWRLLGLDLATHKAQLSNCVTWIGYDISTEGSWITVSIKSSFMQDLYQDTVKLLKRNFISIRTLRSYTGRANHVANLLFGWRPFLDSLWAAVSGDVQRFRVDKKKFNRSGKQRTKFTKAPKGLIWTKQVASSLLWIKRFLAEEHGPLSRSWCYDDFFGEHSEMTFYIDASPWGLGGILIQNGIMTHYFFSALTSIDEKIHGRKIGDSAGQQTWECLAILVALTIWQTAWDKRKCELRIRSDNIAALSMGAKMKIKSSPLIARELALLYSRAAHEPRVFEHVPGISNSIADTLSRLCEPGVPPKLPPQLANATRTGTPSRSRSWYKTLSTE